MRPPSSLTLAVCTLLAAGPSAAQLETDEPPDELRSSPVIEAVALDVPLYPQGENLWCWAAASQMIMAWLTGCREATAALRKERESAFLLEETAVGCCSPDVLKSEEDRRDCRVKLREVLRASVFGQEDFQCREADRLRSEIWEVAAMPAAKGGAGAACCQKDPLRGRKSGCVEGSWPQFRFWGFDYRWENRALSWDQLTAEIRAGRPVAFSWYNETAGGHMMVATGYVLRRSARSGGPHAGKWVVVNDPEPPGFGNKELIPFEYYLEGTHGHYRDYWEIRKKGSSGGGR